MIHWCFKISTRLFGKKTILYLLKKLSEFSRAFAYRVHKLQFRYEWNTEPTPEWFDHFCDLYYLFPHTKNPLWLERGIFNLLAIKKDASVLELCGGDGYNTFHFYSIRAKRIISLDFDKTAIAHARKYNYALNIEYLLSDLRIDLPVGSYDNIIWDAGISLFTTEEMRLLLDKIKSHLKEEGILSGYTVAEKENREKSLKQHKYEFRNKEELNDFLTPYFKNIKVFETMYPSRTNLYFWASDSTLPFDKNWEHMAETMK